MSNEEKKALVGSKIDGICELQGAIGNFMDMEDEDTRNALFPYNSNIPMEIIWDIRNNIIDSLEFHIELEKREIIKLIGSEE